MKPEIKKMWTDALRSGDYAQGQKTLRSGDRYCCGDRWSSAEFTDGEEVPMIYGQLVEEYSSLWSQDKAIVYYLSGEKRIVQLEGRN